MTRHVFNTNSIANIKILVYKFVAGLSRFGYHCKTIAGSLLNPKIPSVQQLILNVYFVVAQCQRYFLEVIARQLLKN